jgi:neopullulanase
MAGDIQGIINHLDYIHDLGFTAIWINPFWKITSPAIPTMAMPPPTFMPLMPDLAEMKNTCSSLPKPNKGDMKIIKDMIFNHCGHHHWWMKDLPSPDWINRWPEFTRTTYRMSTILDPHFAQADYDVMMRGWFDRNMPDLNQLNRLLATYLIQNSVWWIEYAGIHGIRMDTQPYADKDFMAEWGNT